MEEIKPLEYFSGIIGQEVETNMGNYFKKFFSEREKKNVIVAGQVNFLLNLGDVIVKGRT